MKIVGQFPNRVQEIENEWISLADGCRLSARMWMPVDAVDRPVPAILEYLPYRKRDGTAVRDELTHPYFAGHGYACLRVDMRGNGESDDLMLDEYLQQEQDDALELIDWISRQPWCDGNVGMIGISWGGFNGLQVAARRPPALKAIITICSTDDRYADDIHYKGGALLGENLGWASTMLAFSSRPPDPVLVGERWRDMWMQRLENTPLLVDNWLQHQRRDAFWKHGSVCEDFSAIEAAVFAVGGWADNYASTIPRMLEGLSAPRLGLIGPWLHKYPHFAVPGPAIGFLQESLRWWDHWLKNMDTGIMDEPLYRAYMLESVRPKSSYDHRDGRWIGEQQWPSAEIEQRVMQLGAGTLGEASVTGDLILSSPQTTGASCGELCPMWLGPDLPTDQREDDAGSLVFDTPPLAERTEIFGAARVTLELTADRPQGLVVVRLCDVWPEGDSTRVAYGILNLAHRDSHEHPSPLTQGERYRVQVELDDVAYAFPLGHRIRLSVSNAYWPLVWPSPEAVTLNVFADASELTLPVRPVREETLRPFEEAEGSPPLEQEVLRPDGSQRTVERDLATGESVMRIVDDFGKHRDKTHHLVTSTIARETYRIHPDDPLSAHADIHWTEELERGDWQVRTESRQKMWADREHFYVHAELEAFEGDERVFSRTWDKKIKRDMV